MKTFTQQLLLFIVILALSCRAKSSKAPYLPFCKSYDFAIKNVQYKLALMRDTSGRFSTYAGTVSNAATSGTIYINPDETDSAWPDILKFDFNGGGNKSFSFSGTVSPDGSVIEGFVKMQQQNTPTDSIRCTIKEGEKLPFAFLVRSGRFQVNVDSMAEPTTFLVKLVWPGAGIPAITAMKYKRDVAEWLEIKSNMHNYSAEEYMRQYQQNFVASYVNNEDLKNTPGYNHDEEVSTSLHYLGEKWMTVSFYRSWFELLMLHHQGHNKYTMYDMRTGNHPGLHHFFTTEGLRKIPALLEKYFRIHNNLKPDEPLTKSGLYDNYIRPNNNYYVTGEALHFYYNAYEIAPYAFGEFDVAIPLSEFGKEFRYQPN